MPTKQAQVEHTSGAEEVVKVEKGIADVANAPRK